MTLVAAREWSRLVAIRAATRAVFVGGILVAGVGLLLRCPQFGLRTRLADRRRAAGMRRERAVLAAGRAGVGDAALADDATVGRCSSSGWIVLVGAWVALVELQARSPWLVLAAMAIVWIADTAAYFVGRAFGRRKLAPEISPGKTWEGVYGALAAVAVYAVCLLPLARDAGIRARDWMHRRSWRRLALALLITAISVIGDLFESLMKRHAGVKDSGNAAARTWRRARSHRRAARGDAAGGACRAIASWSRA